MKNTYKLGLVSMMASMALVGCGGGSSASTPLVTGNLFNTYVEGANYVCSSGKTGTTDKMGTYTCNVGDTVEFFLGNYSIGSTDAADGILDVETNLPNGAVVMRLLEGIDSAEDGFITIPEDFNDLDNVTAAPGDTDFEKEVNAAGITLEDPTVVAENHAESLLEVYLGGKTFYVEEETYSTNISFDTNLTTMNVGSVAVTIGTTSPLSTGIVDTTLQSGGLQVPGLGLLTLTEKTEHYLLFTYNTDQTIKFYFDEDIANLVSAGYTPLTEEMLSGKTFYTYEYNPSYQENIYAKMTFSGGTLTRTEINNGEGPYSMKVSYAIIGGKIRVDVPAMDGDPAMYVVMALLSEGTDSWTVYDAEDQDRDGINDIGQVDTWYLSKPAEYPASL